MSPDPDQALPLSPAHFPVKIRAATQEHLQEIAEGLGGFGQKTDDFVSFCSWAMSPHGFDPDSKKPGEHLLWWGETDGFRGRKIVADMLWRAMTRDGVTQIHILISGGNIGDEESHDNLPAHRMLEALRLRLDADNPMSKPLNVLQTDGRVSIDALSRHTGHQVRHLRAWCETFGVKRLGIVLPLYHMPRWLLTFAEAWRGSDGTLKKPDGLTIYPMPYGRLETTHRTKGPVTNLEQRFTYRELLFTPAAKMPKFNFSAGSGGRDDTSEFEKILDTWRNPSKYFCGVAKLDEALDFYGLR